MKLLTLADIHGAWDTVYMVEELDSLYDFDVLVIAGDITDFGPGEFALKYLKAINKMVLAVPGNCDPPEVLDAIEKSGAVSLHKNRYVIEDYTFIGLGGTNGRGFSMGISFSEDFAYSFLRGCKGCIFVTHQPPLGILDKVGGRHIGSKGIRDAVFEAKPMIVVSGHVHEARGVERIGTTQFVNPGPAREGYAALIDLENSTVKMIEK